jgi:hypothetical protein
MIFGANRIALFGLSMSEMTGDGGSKQKQSRKGDINLKSIRSKSDLRNLVNNFKIQNQS